MYASDDGILYSSTLPLIYSYKTDKQCPYLPTNEKDGSKVKHSHKTWLSECVSSRWTIKENVSLCSPMEFLLSLEHYNALRIPRARRRRNGRHFFLLYHPSYSPAPAYGSHSSFIYTNSVLFLSLSSDTSSIIPPSKCYKVLSSVWWVNSIVLAIIICDDWADVVGFNHIKILNLNRLGVYWHPYVKSRVKETFQANKRDRRWT